MGVEDIAPGTGFTGQPPAELTSDERTWAMFCHLSAIISAWFYAGFIGPLIVWLLKKDQSPFVDYHGKEALNFQLNILGYGLIAIVFAIVTCGFGAFLAVPLMAAVGIYALVMVIVASIKASSGEYFRYPATIRLIK
jgi:uncharacterized Tic20 family protein